MIFNLYLTKHCVVMPDDGQNYTDTTSLQKNIHTDNLLV